jgi:transcriptional regulator GlxA family with amidase domain
MRNAEHKDYESVNITSHSLCGAVPCVESAVNITVRLLAPTLSPVKSSSGMAVMPDELLNQSARYDLVIIPAGADSDTIRSFVKANYDAGGAVMSVCTGARTLAQLGLLDGRDATTNTLLLVDYERSFPKVRWTSLFDRTDRRFIVSEPPLRIITTAGVTAGIDGALHFVSAWLGEAAAEAIREYNEWPLQLEG